MSNQSLPLPLLTHRLDELWRTVPERLAFVFLSEGPGRQIVEERISYGALVAQSTALAAELVAEGAEGKRVLIVHPQGREFMVSFLACLYAGAVAVPLPTPSPTSEAFGAAGSRRFERHGRKNRSLRGIVLDADASFVLGALSLQGRLMATETLPEFRTLPWKDANVPRPPFSGSLPLRSHQDLAFLQYTSGSTSAPRGVEVTQGNLAVYLRDHVHTVALSKTTVQISWLPPYHDMGLIGMLLSTLMAGCHAVVMPPPLFVQNPNFFIQAISSFRANVSFAPNFSYELCASRADSALLKGCDLSCVEALYNAAEPVRASTLERFYKTFAPYGLRRSAVRAAYGLAEATLGVSSGTGPAQAISVDRKRLAHNEARVTSLESDAQILVSSGRLAPSVHVEIVEPNTQQRLETNQVGEIWIAGPTIARGYWNQPTASQETFGATLPQFPEKTFLRTGDLGFLDKSRELFVTGRIKDLIKIYGVNRYPQDLEASVEQCHPAIVPSGVAVLGIEEEEEEHLAVVCEVTRQTLRADAVELEDIVATICQAILNVHDLAPARVVLVRAGSLDKTTSGKIQRRSNRQRLIDNQLDVVFSKNLPRARLWNSVADIPPASPFPAEETALETLMWVLASVLQQPHILPDQTFIALGGDSVQAMQVSAKAQGAGLSLRPEDLLGDQTLKEVATACEQRASALREPTPNVDPPAVHEANTVEMPVPLDHPKALNKDAKAETHVERLDSTRTRQLTEEIPAVHHATVSEVILAVGWAFASRVWEIPGFGANLALPGRVPDSAVEALKAIKQNRGRLPLMTEGVVSRFLGVDTEGVGAQRERPLIIDFSVRDSRMEIHWQFNSAVLDASTVQRWAQSLLQLLVETIDECATAATVAVQPADFPMANLSSEELQKLLDEE